MPSNVLGVEHVLFFARATYTLVLRARYFPCKVTTARFLSTDGYLVIDVS